MLEELVLNLRATLSVMPEGFLNPPQFLKHRKTHARYRLGLPKFTMSRLLPSDVGSS